MVASCRPGPAALISAWPLPVRCRARTVQVPGAAKKRKSPPVGGDDLTGEVAVGVEQAHERATDRGVTGDDPSGEHHLGGQVDVGGQGGRLDRGRTSVAHGQDSVPTATGTPTREPYSVHDPS